MSLSDDFALRMDIMAEQWEGDNDESSNPIMQDGSCLSDSQHCNRSSSAVTSTTSSSTSSSMVDQEKQLHERRAFLHSMLSNTATAAVVSTTATAIGFTSISTSAMAWHADPAFAYEQSYPLELQMTPAGETENSSNSITKRNEERLSYKKAKVMATKMELRNDPLGVMSSSPFSSSHEWEVTIAGALTWALALWLASGSRSNPIVTPLANVLYDDDGYDENESNKMNKKSAENQWLADRNDGYFGELPPSFMAVLSAVFVVFGVILDRAVYFLADGDAEISLQLGGVSVIGGAVWEVGRLAAKEKAPTRIEYERESELYREFREFAEKRIVVGGGRSGGVRSSETRSLPSSISCHRSEVISAFRRYNPKYRTADNDQYPLLDIEIERILRRWNREFGSGSEMSSAGFLSGISIDGAADAFAPR